MTFIRNDDTRLITKWANNVVTFCLFTHFLQRDEYLIAYTLLRIRQNINEFLLYSITRMNKTLKVGLLSLNLNIHSYICPLRINHLYELHNFLVPRTIDYINGFTWSIVIVCSIVK